MDSQTITWPNLRLPSHFDPRKPYVVRCFSPKPWLVVQQAPLPTFFENYASSNLDQYQISSETDLVVTNLKINYDNTAKILNLPVQSFWFKRKK